MYLKIDNAFADGELALLVELLEVLDAKLAGIHDDISLHADPDGAGLLDKGEYFLGVGLCAIQQYLVDTLTFTGLTKRDAFDLGPATAKGDGIVAAINAGANWWKHSAEWWSASSDPFHGARTAILLQRVVGGNTEYARQTW